MAKITAFARKHSHQPTEVTSTFVEKALKLAQPDIDMLVVEQQLRDFEDTQMLAQLFADMLQADEEGEHKVGLKEFQELLETYQFRWGEPRVHPRAGWCSCWFHHLRFVGGQDQGCRRP